MGTGLWALIFSAPRFPVTGNFLIIDVNLGFILQWCGDPTCVRFIGSEYRYSRRQDPRGECLLAPKVTTIVFIDAFHSRISLRTQPLLSILNAHEFPSTVLRFNPSSTMLISGSADNSVRVVEVPSSLGEKSNGALITVIWVLLAVLVVLLGVFLQSGGSIRL